MIAHVKGDVVDKLDGRLIIDVNGIGYEVLIPQIDYDEVELNQNIKLHTYFHVRETAQELYGFLTRPTKQLFELLISVSGVGPKGALAILSLGDESQVRSAIAGGNIAYLTGASGVGKRVAERVSVDLKDKVGVMGEFATTSQTSDVVEALVALGYSKSQASQALRNIDQSQAEEEQIRQALKELS